MKHVGDITKLNGAELPIVDIITGGSPCQDLSVAGKRAGLAGERSGLFMEQIRIIKEMRNESIRQIQLRGSNVDNRQVKPRYMVWENVPGALSSGEPKGGDFRAVLEETARVADQTAVIPGPPKNGWSTSGCIMGKGWSIAWRVHDSQFWGITVTTPDGRVVKRGTPQRRKRISLVADFGGETAPEILFERESVSGDLEPSGETWQGTSSNATRSTNPSSYTLKIRGGVEVDSKGKKAGKGALVQTELSGTLGVCQDQTLITRCLNDDEFEQQVEDFVQAVNKDAKHQQDLIQSDLGIARTLASGTYASGSHLTKTLITNTCYGIDQQCGKGGANYTTDVSPTLASDSHGTPHGVVYGMSPYGSNAMKSDNPHSGIYEADTSRTLDVQGGNPACNQGGMMVVQGADVYNASLTGDVAATLTEACGGTNTSGAKVVCLEGNGSRPSYIGNGYKESDILNTVEQHGMCYELDKESALTYRKTSHAKSADDGQGWQETETNDTLNAFDNCEGRTPTLIVGKAVESHAQDARYGIGEVNQPLSANMEHDPANGGLVLDNQNQQETVLTFSNVHNALNARDGRSGVHSQMLDQPENNFVMEKEIIGEQNKSVVRRLTPLECERLQGFPDFWTNIGEWTDTKGKKHKDADSPRYKALGNSIALPFWKWMAERMLKELGEEHPTMASLFDGIGGFPLVFSLYGCKPVFSSEIEQFPIAVVKKHFGDDDTGEIGDYEQYL